MTSPPIYYVTPAGQVTGRFRQAVTWALVDRLEVALRAPMAMSPANLSQTPEPSPAAPAVRIGRAA